MCTLPREFGGPRYECMECSSAFEPEKRHWECTVSYKVCQDKKPVPPPPLPDPPEKMLDQDYYDSVDDNAMSETIVKGVVTAGVTELANKLHVRRVADRSFDVLLFVFM